MGPFDESGAKFGVSVNPAATRQASRCAVRRHPLKGAQPIGSTPAQGAPTNSHQSSRCAAAKRRLFEMSGRCGSNPKSGFGRRGGGASRSSPPMRVRRRRKGTRPSRPARVGYSPNVTQIKATAFWESPAWAQAGRRGIEGVTNSINWAGDRATRAAWFRIIGLSLQMPVAAGAMAGGHFYSSSGGEELPRTAANLPD
jgi:hypothetical protein